MDPFGLGIILWDAENSKVPRNVNENAVCDIMESRVNELGFRLRLDGGRTPIIVPFGEPDPSRIPVRVMSVLQADSRVWLHDCKNPGDDIADDFIVDCMSSLFHYRRDRRRRRLAVEDDALVVLIGGDSIYRKGLLQLRSVGYQTCLWYPQDSVAGEEMTDITTYSDTWETVMGV